jgi:hypothetical protein
MIKKQYNKKHLFCLNFKEFLDQNTMIYSVNNDLYKRSLEKAK